MPQSRIEAILENILGADNPIGSPQSRNEYLLIQIMEMLSTELDFEAIAEEEITEIIDAIS